jgi:hypothetical protein
LEVLLIFDEFSLASIVCDVMLRLVSWKLKNDRMCCWD